jgi:hypothetical protein
MPRQRVNPKWIEDRKMEVRAFLTPARTSIPPVTTSYNPAAQWYISYLDLKNLKCKVIQLGAGVKKIIHMENICPHCGGKGTI